MADYGRGNSRRAFLLSSVAAARLAAQETPITKKGASYPPEVKRYEDPTTELDVYRLTDPAHTSVLPAYYNRAIAHNSSWMLFCSDRTGTAQVCRMDLKSGESKELTDAKDLDGSSLTLTPDNRSFCYFAGRSLYISTMAGRGKLCTLFQPAGIAVPD